MTQSFSETTWTLEVLIINMGRGTEPENSLVLILSLCWLDSIWDVMVSPTVEIELGTA